MKKKLMIGVGTSIGMVAGVLIGITAPSNASTETSQAGIVQPQFIYVGCQLTMAPKPAHNNSGHVVVVAGNKPVNVVKRVNGKQTNTYGVKAGKTRQLSFVTSNTRTKTEFQIKAKTGGNYLSQPLQVGKGMCIKK